MVCGSGRGLWDLGPLIGKSLNPELFTFTTCLSRLDWIEWNQVCVWPAITVRR